MRWKMMDSYGFTAFMLSLFAIFQQIFRIILVYDLTTRWRLSWVVSYVSLNKNQKKKQSKIRKIIWNLLTFGVKQVIWDTREKVHIDVV